MRETESVKKMKENFYTLSREGKSVKEIADKYGISTYSIYNSLQEIADLNGISREELLNRPHKPHIITKKGNKKEAKELVDVKELKERFDSMIKEADEIILLLQDSLEKYVDDKER